MNTSFKILWFEDKPEWYKMERRRIEAIIKKHDLKLEVDRKDGSDFNISSLMGNQYDLILMDYQLAQEVKGDAIASAIRASNILTDILFYSSHEEEMIEAILEKRPLIDGIYFAKRSYEAFTLKVEGLVDKIIRRSEDLVNLRGFVMDESADFEVRIREILNIVWGKFSDEEREILDKSVLKTIESNEKRDKKTYEEVMKKPEIFLAAVNHSHFFSHSDRLYLLQKAIEILKEKHKLEEVEEFSNFKHYYQNDISQYRNALGHKKATENTIEVPKGTLVEIDTEFHRKMRRNLVRYNELIEKLEIFVAEQL